MQCYTELVPPSGVTDALAIPFTSGDAKNLLVARTSLIQIFTINTGKQTDDLQASKLVLTAEFSLSGSITSLGRVKILQSKSGGEAVLIAFRDAKLSLIEWDPDKHSICTISIHYYENETLQKNPWVPELRDCISHLTVDPSSRCAVFHFGITNVAIIPFHQIGDDLVMDDYAAEFDEENTERSPTKKTNDDIGPIDTPYRSSFVLPLTTLDPAIIHPVHLTFLHEYREPTFGILFSSIARSPALNYERRDVTQYAVFTLDLEQRASTKLQSISRLPNDLNRVIALPLPVGGALLVGDNELVHVDQGGKMNAVGVNDFARQISSFSMADQSQSNMKLEGCQIELLNTENGDMLIVLASGDLAMLSFRLDGRSVSGMSVRHLSQDRKNPIFRARSSCTSFLGAHCLFVGSDVADSILLSSARKPLQLRKHSSRGAQKRETSDDDYDFMDGEDDEDEDDDDDLYGESVEKSVVRQSDIVQNAGSHLRILDRLTCSAPLRDFTIGRVVQSISTEDHNNSRQKDTDLKLGIVTASGQGATGGVSVFSREVPLQVTTSRQIGPVSSVWSFSFRKGDEKVDSSQRLDRFLLTSNLKFSRPSQSTLYDISERAITEKKGTDFDPASGGTVDCGLIANESHLVQVLEGEIRVYDSDFNFPQIWPIVDEDNDTLAKAVSASFADPYVLVLKEDSSLLVLEADKKGELDEIDLNSDLSATSFASATLYHDRKGILSTNRDPKARAPSSKDSCLLVTLSTVGALSMFSGTNFGTKTFHYEGVHFLPPLLGLNFSLPRHWKASQSLSEILMADLGDANDSHPYLLLRSNSGDIAIYEPFVSPRSDNAGGNEATLRFKKLPSRNQSKSDRTGVPETEESDVSQKVKKMKTAILRDLHVVFLADTSSSVIARRASTTPKTYDISIKATAALGSHNTATCPHGLAYVEPGGQLCTATIPLDIMLGESQWVQKKVELGHDVSHIQYLEQTGSYILGTSDIESFQLPQDDEWHTEWQHEKLTSFPGVPRGSVRLLSSTTFNVINSFQLDPAERILCMKTMNLEVSEESHERKDLIVVGTAVTKGEDVVARGAIYIFDIVDVVPQPGVPETDLKLKLIAKEDVKGAVTSLCSIGSQGFLLAAQGQKCMVRGLKEDLSILPVAFMDMQYYVHVVKELAGTGLCIMGDAMNGLWFVGYSEEPYKLQLFGRDQANLDVVAADFLPDGKNLYINVADGNGDLHILQFDPDSPESERGMRLLHRSSFFLGSFVSNMTILPRGGRGAHSEAAFQNGSQSQERGEDDPPRDSTTQPNTPSQQYQILLTSQEGSIGLLTPLAEPVYQRLQALQNILTATLEHPCGLNPRAYRAVETDGIGGAAIVDGDLVLRWRDQDLFHQMSLADKVGSNVWEVAEDLAEVSGRGVEFL